MTAAIATPAIPAPHARTSIGPSGSSPWAWSSCSPSSPWSSRSWCRPVDPAWPGASSACGIGAHRRRGPRGHSRRRHRASSAPRRLGGVTATPPGSWADPQPARPRPGWPAPVRDADAADVRLRVPRRRPRPVSRRARARPADHRDRPDADADRRHPDLAVADDERRSVRPSPRPRRRRRPDDRRRHRVRLHELGAAADPGRDDRRHLADRQRGRPVPRRRAGGAVPDGPRRPPDADLRLVQPRRATSRPPPAPWRPVSSARSCSTAAGRRSTPTARSSSATPLIGLAMVVGFWRARSRDRGAATRGGDRRDPAPARPRALEADRPQAVGPVLDRCLRRRLHPAEPDGVLVPHAVGRRSGASSG